MVRRVTPSQYRSMVRQAQSKQKQAIDKYNRGVRAHNQKVKTTINKINQEVNQYKSEVRKYNARVRANQARLRHELNKLQQAASRPRYVTLKTSFESVYSSYARLEANAESSRYGENYNEILDLSEREAANSASVFNAILGNPEELDSTEKVQSSALDHILAEISTDLLNRWHGALFALNPGNPDAARHFCTSAREILTQILVFRAPESLVLQVIPDCQKTRDGKPTRRSRIRYFLHLSQLSDEILEDFIENDMENVMELFNVFNVGTHGAAGRFNIAQLIAIKKRVEDAISFLWRVIPR